MKFPSLNRITGGVRRAAERFPAALIAALVLISGFVILIEETTVWGIAPHRLQVLMHVLALVLPASLVAGVYGERAGWRRGTRMLGQMVVLALCGVGMALAPGWPIVSWNVHMALIGVALTLVVVFAPFMSGNEENGLWQYNRLLVQRAFVAAVYGISVWLGLLIALASANFLFDLHMKGIRFAELWVIVAGLVSSLVFFGGLPDRFAELEHETAYPKGLRIFTMYLLLPLVALYLLILYAYVAKTAFTWEMPKGMVAWLVTGFSAAGIAALLLVYPIRERDENRFVRLFSRIFFWALYPLIAFMGYAIWLRVVQYGITEIRYLLIAAALWLAVFTTVSVVSKLRHLRSIPRSLAMLCIAVSFGPWSATRVSVSSQSARLRGLLEQNSLLVDGRVRPSNHVSDSARREISAAVRFLVDRRELADMQTWTGGSLDGVVPAGAPVEEDELGAVRKIVGLFGTTYLAPSAPRPTEGPFAIRRPDTVAVRVTGFDDAFRFEFWRENSGRRNTEYTASDSTRWRVGFDDTLMTIVVLGPDSLRGGRYNLNCAAVVRAWMREPDDAHPSLDTTFADSVRRVKISIRGLHGESDRSGIRITSVAGWMMIGRVSPYPG